LDKHKRQQYQNQLVVQSHHLVEMILILEAVPVVAELAEK